MSPNATLTLAEIDAAVIPPNVTTSVGAKIEDSKIGGFYINQTSFQYAHYVYKKSLGTLAPVTDTMAIAQGTFPVRGSFSTNPATVEGQNKNSSTVSYYVYTTNSKGSFGNGLAGGGVLITFAR